MAALKNATRKHHQLIRTTKRSSFRERLDNNTHNSKELFNVVKELSNPNASNNDITPSQDLCNSLATFFHRKIVNIYDSFGAQNSYPTTEPTPPTTTLCARTQVRMEDTTHTMNTIHSGSSADPCPHHIFNKADSIIAPKLRDIINNSFISATFPESWKHAEISALQKKPTADPSDLKNFRPISLLPFPAKVIDKTINKQLTAFLETNGSLDPSQSGF
ncbi:ras-related protein Rab-17 isoform X2 [Lissotriton helveticus]